MFMAFQRELENQEKRMLLNCTNQVDGFMLIPNSREEKHAIYLFASTSKFLSSFPPQCILFIFTWFFNAFCISRWYDPLTCQVLWQSRSLWPTSEQAVPDLTGVSCHFTTCCKWWSRRQFIFTLRWNYLPLNHIAIRWISDRTTGY